MEHRIPLSFEKLVQLLDRYKYDIDKIYCVEDNIKFIQIKSPRYQKIFFINIPDRFVMTCETFCTIYQSHENIQQKDYMEMLSEVLSTDIICMTNENICYYKKHFEFYSFKEVVKRAAIIMKEDDVISKLESEFNDLKKKVNTVDNMVMVKNKSTSSPKVELIFEDNEGNEIKKGEDLEKMIITQKKKIHIDKNTVVDLDLCESAEESPIMSQESDDESIDETIVDINEFPTTENEISIGMIYICVDIDKFFKNAKTFEDKLLEEYQILDKKEQESREEKIHKIEEIIETFKINSLDRIQHIEIEENNIKQHLHRLSSVLLSCGNLQKNAKDEESKQDVQEITEKTKKAIADLNLKLLQLRDDAHTILDKCSKYVEEAPY